MIRQCLRGGMRRCRPEALAGTAGIAACAVHVMANAVVSGATFEIDGCPDAR